MQEDPASHPRLQLRAESPAGNGGATYSAYCDGVRLATVLTPVAGAGDREREARVVVERPWEWGRREALALLDALFVVLGGDRAGVAVSSSDLILRDEARRRGFRGPLRGPLRRRPGAGSDGRGPVDLLDELLSTAEVRARPTGPLRSFLRNAVAGLPRSLELTVTLAAGARALRVTFPDDPDLLAEGVALAIDTVRAVNERFGPWVGHVRVLSFDYAGHGMRTGAVGGQAHHQAAIVHVNASYVLAEGLPRLLGRGRTVSDEFTKVEEVTAHELWHHIEYAFEARRYRDSVEFRRRLGEHFGVETIEQAVMGSAAGAPPAWQAAQARLVAEVSPYAGTRAAEATAEMFRLALFQPQPRISPAVHCFMRAVDDFLPAPAARP